MKAKFTKTNFYIIVILFLALIVGLAMPMQTAKAAGPLYVDPAGNDSNDCLSTGTACATIAGAVAKASDGDTINVAAGTYVEQIEITKPLTLNGAGPTTIIQSPTSLALSFTPPGSTIIKPVVYVHGTNNATIQNLTIDGAGLGNANYRFTGLAFYDAGGRISNAEVKNIGDTPFSGSQHGIGIYVRSDLGTARTLEVDHVNVHDYQKGGIVFHGANLSVNAHGNTVTGVGTTDKIAQNGIQVSGGAAATLDSNVVSGNSFHLVGNAWDWASAGILLTGAGPVNLTGGNALSGNDQNLYIDSATSISIGAEVIGPSSAPVDFGYNIINYTTLSLNLTGVTFPGAANNFEIEDRIWHGVDDPLSGLATWVAGNLYVTPSSGAGAIQRAIDLANPCDTINVDAGTYDIDTTIVVNKCITISGPTSGTAKIVGTGTDMFKVFEISASNVTIQNLEITLATTPAYPLLVSDELASSLISIPSGTGMTGIAITNNTIYVPVQTPPMTGWTARAITVGSNTVSGMSITGNTIYNTRNGVVIHYNNSVTLSNNIIYNTKGGIMNYTGSQADADNRTMSNNSWGTVHNEWDIVWNSGGGPFAQDYNKDVLLLSGANNDAYVLSLMVMLPGTPTTVTGNRSHVWVNSATGTTTLKGSNGNMNLPYAKIQDGIDAVVPGGTVYVAAGTYPEQITIAKPLTLTGADGAVLDGTGLAPTWTTGVKIKSGNVTFNNIDVTNFTQDGIIVGYEASIPGNLQNVHITNSKISNIQPGYWGFGIYVGYESEGFRYAPPKLTTHLDYSGLLIEGNEITNVHSSAMVIQSLTGTPGTLVVRNNNIHDNTTNSGIWVDCARNLLIENNTVVANKWGVEIGCYAESQYPALLPGPGTPDGPYSPKDIILRGNLISDNTFEGIALYEAWPGTFTITGNRIQRNGSGVNNPLAVTLSAINNWWGAASGPGTVGPGTGDTVSTNIDFSPWCANDACTGNPPPMPSSFYGYIHIYDDAPSAGDKINAYIPGISGIAASGTIITDPGTGDLGYQIKVPGDVVGTSTKEGGAEGDTITFQIGSRIVATAFWQEGTNVWLDIHPPQALPDGTYSGNEGSAIAFSGSANDWGGSVGSSYEWDWDNTGPYDETGQTPSHTWTDNGSYTVGLKVTDAQGGEGTTTFVVWVWNVAPIAAFTASGPVNEGGSSTISFMSPYDPSTVDTAAGFKYSFACDGEDGSLAMTYAAAETATTTTCSFFDNGVYTVKGRIFDKDNEFTNWLVPVTVNNVPPTVTLSTGNTYEWPESSTAERTFNYTATDPGGIYDPLVMTINCGTGGSYVSGSDTGSSFRCIFADGPASPTISVSANDGDGGITTDSHAVTVNNVAPAATLGNNGPKDEGSLFTISFSGQIDPSSADLASLHYAFDCNGGSLASATYAGSGVSASQSCTFNDKGSYTVSGKVMDKDGGFYETTTSVTVNDVPPTNVDAHGDYTGMAGTPVAISGSATCAPVDTCTFTWDLDGDMDYTDATGTLISFTWNTIGNYTISLKVTDTDLNEVTDTATVNIGGATHGIGLVVGWNLVSFNLHPANTNIATVLSSIAGNYDLVYAWDAIVSSNNWKKYSPTAPVYSNSLSALDEKMGFWIHMTAPGTLNVVGSIPTTTSISLSTTGGGWNLVGYPSAGIGSLPGALSGVNFSLVYAYHANEILDPWKLFGSGTPPWANDLTALTSGWGYWIKVGTSSAWSVNY